MAPSTQNTYSAGFHLTTLETKHSIPARSLQQTTKFCHVQLPNERNMLKIYKTIGVSPCKNQRNKKQVKLKYSSSSIYYLTRSSIGNRFGAATVQMSYPKSEQFYFRQL